MDQIDADSNIGWVENIQRLNTLAALLATGGSIILNPAGLAAVSGEIAAIQLVGNFTAGAAGGYVEGGLSTAAIRVAQNILPVNTISSLVDHESGWGDVVLSAVRDVGNTFNLVQGGSYLEQQLISGTADELGGDIDDLASAAMTFCWHKTAPMISPAPGMMLLPQVGAAQMTLPAPVMMLLKPKGSY